MRIIEKIAYYTLNKKIKAAKRQVELPHPDQIRKVGVVWRPDEKAAFQYLHDYFTRDKVIFRNICVYKDHAGVAADTSIITSKDLNWLGLPKPGPIDDFIETQFDVLFNIALEQNLVLDYITSLSRASFKIGWSPQKSNFFDLNINIPGKQDALYLAQQQIYYLAQLNKTT
ncbi:MAG: DUF6913 domain-containing protein [Bacteroidota bacterium]